jgi:hypothetical protein
VANELSPALVVMATHGRGALSRLLLESVASETLRKLTVPVLLIRPNHAHDEAEADVALTGATSENSHGRIRGGAS